MEIISTLLSVTASAIVSTIIGTVIKRAVEKGLDKNLNEQKELSKLRAEKERAERKEDVLETLRNELEPIEIKLDNMSTKLDNCIRGTVTLLRESMKQSKDEFIKKGYISVSERANWHELYKTYSDLGGNHFKEYVDEWKNAIDALPNEKVKKSK